MSWRDLLQTENESLVAPWVGGRTLRSRERTWKIEGKLPQEYGWFSFKLNGRKAFLQSGADPNTDILVSPLKGYLVGDRIISDTASVNPDPSKISEHSEPVFCLERGLDRFVRVSAGRPYEGGPLVYVGQEFPLGAEDAVTRSYLHRNPSVNDVPGVSPALDAAFRLETWSRSETERRRVELERQRAEEEARRAAEERRQEMAQKLGTGEGRRAMAAYDFREAARAALAVTGAEYLDHKASYRAGEITVTFRFIHRTFICVCDEKTLRIIDAGICLTDHTTRKRWDDYLALETLPAVIREAQQTGVLVVTRHTGYDDGPEDDYDD